MVDMEVDGDMEQITNIRTMKCFLEQKDPGKAGVFEDGGGDWQLRTAPFIDRHARNIDNFD